MSLNHEVLDTLASLMTSRFVETDQKLGAFPVWCIQKEQSARMRGDKTWKESRKEASVNRFLLVNHIALSTAVGGSQMLLRLFFTTRDVTQLLHQVVVPSYAILPTGSHLFRRSQNSLKSMQLTTVTIIKILTVTRPRQKT